MKNIIIFEPVNLFSIALTLTSCEKVIHVKQNNASGKIDIEANLTNVQGQQIIYIRENVPFTNTNTYRPVTTNKTNCIAVVNEASQHFGNIDAVINNAGYTVFGAIEENSEREARDLFEVNVFGTFWMTQAILPIFGEQGKGHIIQLSSVLGVNSLPTMGLYCATKYAVEGFSEALQMEVKDFGINVTLIEPNSFKTDFFGSSAIESTPLDAYSKVTADFRAGDGLKPENIGDPNATVEAILSIVDSKNPPLRLFLGKLAYPWTQYTYSEKLASWGAWKEVSAKVHGE